LINPLESGCERIKYCQRPANFRRSHEPRGSIRCVETGNSTAQIVEGGQSVPSGSRAERSKGTSNANVILAPRLGDSLKCGPSRRSYLRQLALQAHQFAVALPVGLASGWRRPGQSADFRLNFVEAAPQVGQVLLGQLQRTTASNTANNIGSLVAWLHL
jgi:hypothetical protein